MHPHGHIYTQALIGLKGINTVLISYLLEIGLYIKCRVRYYYGCYNGLREFWISGISILKAKLGKLLKIIFEKYFFWQYLKRIPYFHYP